jgi:hypothetical protein
LAFPLPWWCSCGHPRRLSPMSLLPIRPVASLPWLSTFPTLSSIWGKGRLLHFGRIMPFT